MNKDYEEQKEFFASQQLFKDVELINCKSPDLAVDLGVLLFIIGKRAYRPPYKDWTTFYVDAFAKQSKMGYKRVAESLERLCKLGIIQRISDKKRKHLAMRYRYAIRDKRYAEVWERMQNSLPNVFSKENELSKKTESFGGLATPDGEYEEAVDEDEVTPDEAVEDVVEEVTHTAKAKQPAKAEATTTPKVEKQVLQSPPTYGIVMHWNGTTMEAVKCTIEEMNAEPICPICHKHFYATQTAQLQTSDTTHDEIRTDDNKPVCILCGLDIVQAHDRNTYANLDGKLLTRNESERICANAHKLMEGNK